MINDILYFLYFFETLDKRSGVIVDGEMGRLERISGAVREILECIGEDVDREGLFRTPERYAKALLFFTKGYTENLEGTKQMRFFNLLTIK